MLIAIISMVFFLIAGLVFFVLYVLAPRKESITRRLAALEATGPTKSILEGSFEAKESRIEKIFEPISKLIPKSPKEVGTTRKKLYQAGFESPSAHSVFYGIRTLLMIGLPLAVYFSGLTRGMPVENTVVIYLACFLAGYIVPDFILSTRVTARKERIQLSLPDALDLLVVCVEAGLGLDQAILRTSEELKITHPEICKEFELVNLELRAGKPRREALKNLADRTGVEDIIGLVSMLVQTDKFGTSIAQSLRVQSDSLRTKRRQRAEERARKVSVKLVFPLVFLIFPALYIMILGPGAITIMSSTFLGGH